MSIWQSSIHRAFSGCLFDKFCTLTVLTLIARYCIPLWKPEFTPRQLRKDVAQLSATLRAKTSGKSTSETDISLPESSGEGLLEADIEWMKQEVQRGSSEAQAVPFVNYDDSTSAAYVASRMPAAYASVFRVLQEVRGNPHLVPRSSYSSLREADMSSWWFRSA